MSLQLRFVSHSEIGPVRKNNQDSGYVSPQLLVVADGMGGAAAGDLASAVAVDTIKELDPHASEGPSTASGSVENGLLERLAIAIRRANERIAELINDDYRLEGMGTTLTGALFDGEKLSLAHIGDSRAYLLRDGRLERLTHDHSWVQSLVDDGKISEAEASVHPHRSLLLKVLNGQPANDPDLTTVTLQAGDRILLCSDGICGLVDDLDIEKALQTADLDEALAHLVDDALAEGGIDNITAIVADVVSSGGGGTTAVLGAAAERAIPAVGSKRTDPVEDTLIRTRPATPPPGSSTEPDDEARYNPQPPRKRRVPRVLAGVLALVLVAGAGLGAAWAWTRTQFFVGAAEQRVAIYQGLPGNVPGLPLSSVYEVQPLLLNSLPVYYQNMITSGIEVDSLDAARRTVAELTETARRCARPTPSPTPRPTPTSTPTARPTDASSSSGAAPPSRPAAPSSTRPTLIGPPAPVSPSTASGGTASTSTPALPTVAPSPSPRPVC
jgi:PPM family protein phosphatase